MGRYLGLEAGDEGRVRIAWVLDLGELVASREMDALDPDGDGALTPAEQEAWLVHRIDPLVAQWTVTRDGVPMVPHVVSHALQAAPGEAGLTTLRVLAEVVADTVPHTPPAHATFTVSVSDTTFAERGGIRDIRADDSSAGTVLNAPSAPRDPTSLRTDHATFTFRRLDLPPAAPRAIAPAPRPARSYVATALAVIAVIAFSAWRYRRRR